ncbi:MAG: hypothetical protein LUC83_11020, partial [Clostridiales bacterium]|nr:hypothetical protein [Clostridiales bacterium]
EELDGYVAVHGHEFLTDDDAVIAESMVESLERVYGDEYAFSCNQNQVTVTALSGEAAVYDIQIYDYLKINGEEVSSEDADETASSEEGDSEDEHEAGLKSKVSEINREPSDEEQAFIDRLHISQLSDEEFPDGGEIYTTLTITGDALSEEEIYS